MGAWAGEPACRLGSVQAYKLVEADADGVALMTVLLGEVIVRLYSLHTRVGDVIGPSHQLTLQGIPLVLTNMKRRFILVTKKYELVFCLPK